MNFVGSCHATAQALAPCCRYSDSFPHPHLIFVVVTVMLQNFFKNKNISKKLKLILKNTIIDKTLTYASQTSTLTKRERKQLNIFERKVYRRILGPVYDNEKRKLEDIN
jgi:hypothetical protein